MSENKDSSLYTASAASTGGALSRRRKKAKVADSKNGEPRVTGAFLRMQRDLNEIEWPPSCTLSFKNKELTTLRVAIKVADGHWKDGLYEFKFDIPDKYPNDGPKVLCLDKVYHPNIDLEGNVCVSVLKGGWKPIYTMQQVVFALIFLFSYPNADDPLNPDAATDMRENLTRFKQHVRSSMQGNRVNNVSFPRNKGLR